MVFVAASSSISAGCGVDPGSGLGSALGDDAAVVDDDDDDDDGDDDDDRDESSGTDGQAPQPDGDTSTTTSDEPIPPEPTTDPGPDSTTGNETTDGADATSGGDDIGPTCADEELQSTTEFSFTGTTSGQADGHSGSCVGGRGGADTTLAFTAPQSGPYIFDTNGSSFDTVLYVLSGSDCAGAELACDDDGGDGTRSELVVELEADEDVIIVVDGYDATNSGSFVLNASFNCGATDLGSALPASATGTTSGGPNEHSGSCQGGISPESIFSWTAPAAGNYRVSTAGSSFDTALYIRDGSCHGAQLGCNDDAVNDDVLTSELNLSLAAGQAIAIFVDGYNGDAGSFNLSITAN